MCLILIARNLHPDLPLVLAANRDEYLDRPTAPARFWGDESAILAGRDLVSGGTWLGVSRTGRVAAVTNVREPGVFNHEARTRGELPAGFLSSGIEASAYVDRVGREADRYNGFNLLVGGKDSLHFLSNRDGEGPRSIPDGVHGVSNATLDTPWPKVQIGKAALSELIRDGKPDLDAIFELLADPAEAPDSELPETGVGLPLERRLSAAFVRMPDYGTRSSTVVLWWGDGHISFVERTYPRHEGVPEMRKFRFKPDS